MPILVLHTSTVSRETIMSNLLIHLREALDFFLLTLAILVPVSTLILKYMLVARIHAHEDKPRKDQLLNLQVQIPPL